jgi:hypothetical protein
MKHDYRKTSIWYKERIVDPRQIIRDFFIYSDLAFYRKTIKQVIRVASSNRIWTKSEPGELVDEFKWLESVINAAYILNKKGKREFPKVAPVIGSESRRDFIPRFLTAKEYGNPYLVFRRFFAFRSLASWKQELQALLDHCIRSTSIREEDKEVDIIGLYVYLTKLVEAAYLIELRENYGEGGVKTRI